jgi:hypothetical protein
MNEQGIDAARVGRRTYHREYQRLRREGRARRQRGGSRGRWGGGLRVRAAQLCRGEKSTIRVSELIETGSCVGTAR